MGVLHCDLNEFSDALLFYIFEEIVPERDELDELIVEFHFLSIWSVHHESLHLEVVVVFQDFPAVDVEELVISVFSEIGFQLDIQVAQPSWKGQSADIGFLDDIFVYFGKLATTEELTRMRATLWGSLPAVTSS